MHNKLFKWCLSTLSMLVLSGPSLADYGVNIPPPKTVIAHQIYDLHLYILIVCAVIFVVVFGWMFLALLKHRKSLGHEAEQFHENTTVEIIWTIIPFVILVVMAIPATKTVLEMKDASNSDMTISRMACASTAISKHRMTRLAAPTCRRRRQKIPIICSKSTIRWWYRRARRCVC